MLRSLIVKVTDRERYLFLFLPLPLPLFLHQQNSGSGCDLLHCDIKQVRDE